MKENMDKIKVYKNTHKSKQALNNHISKIKERNGLYQVMQVNDRYHIEYSFPNNNKISVPILIDIKKSIKNKSLSNFINYINSKEYGGGESFNATITSLFPTILKTDIKGNSMSRNNPISLTYKGGVFFITDGNHRYYEALNRGENKILCRIDKTHKVRLETLFNAINEN